MLSQLKKKRNNSSASIAANKGLLNEPGENNCFLNSAIQVLWHLDVFRKSFRLLKGHACMGASCIFCALKDIFDQFQYSKDHALPPNVLRSALAESFQEENKFQLGLMDDAAECFENILNRIHVHIGNTKDEDVCTAPHCIPHQKFGLTLIQHSVCPCGATSEPFPFIEMVHYVSASALCTENEIMCDNYGISSTSQMFGRLIRMAGSWGDMRNCPSNCGEEVEMRNVLMNCPDVVSIGIVWDSDEPEVRNIVNLVNALGTTLRLTDLFHTVVDDRAKQMELYLVGMVCYYGKHYSTFFFHTKLRKWVYFDDAQVSEIGKRWSNVISKCIKGHHQPLLLLYANPNASPVSASTAPERVTLLPGYSRDTIKHEPLVELPETESIFTDEDSTDLIDTVSSNIDSTPSSSLNFYLPPEYSRSSHQGRARETVTPPSSTYNSNKKEKPARVEKKEKSSKPKHKSDSPSSDHFKQKPLPPTPNESSPRSKNVKKESRPKKSAFQWNLTDEQSRKQTKSGHYVEPQPANWTQHRPYTSNQSSSSSLNPQPTQKIIKQSPEKRTTRAKRYSQDDRYGSPSPSTRSQPTNHLVVERKSPSHSRKSSHSSQSSISSLGRSSNKSTTTERSSAVEVTQNSHVSAHTELDSSSVYAPSTVSRISRNSDSRGDLLQNEETLHASSLSYLDKNSIDLTPILTPAKSHEIPKHKPSLPPKPPFLSKPFSKSPSTFFSRPNHSPSQNTISTTLPLSNSSFATTLPLSNSSFATTLPLSNSSFATTLPLSNSSFKPKPTQAVIDPTETKALDCPDRIRNLFRDAEKLMERSREADRNMDYAVALQLSLEATKAFETIMMTENLSEDFLVEARMRHGECVNCSQVLQRRKKLRSKPKGSELEVRSSGRHSTNPIIRPSKPPPTSRGTSSPNSAMKKVLIGREAKDDDLIGEMERRDADDNLIDFNKHGMTKFQHVVQSMFKRPNDYKQGKPRTPPVVLISKKTNLNNNNSNVKDENKSVNNDQPGSTPIFVWSNPNQTDPKSNSSVSVEGEKNQSSLSPATDLSNELSSLTFASNPGQDAGIRTVQKDFNKVRSVTPPPAAKIPSVSQQRRSKTPTPSTNKELLRSKMTLSKRKENKLKLQVNPITDQRNKQTDPTSETRLGSATPNFSGFPYPYQAWGPTPLKGPHVSPSTMPPEYYESFIRLMQYYSTLSPEQQPSYFPISNGNPATSPFPRFPTSNPSSGHLMDDQKAQLVKNLTNYSNSVGRNAPVMKAKNSNIYESNKPKPINKTHRSVVSSDPVPISSTTSLQSNSGSLRRSHDSQTQNRPTNQQPSNDPRDKPHLSSNKSSASNINHTSPEGMMKWAEAGKKRQSHTTPETREKLLLEYANRNKRTSNKSNGKGYSPSTKLVPSVIDPRLSSTASLPLQVTAIEKCSLCGLVEVQALGAYCPSCRAYLARLNPLTSSIRSRKTS